MFINVAGYIYAQPSCNFTYYQDKDTGCFPYPILATATQNTADIEERMWYLTTCAGATIYETPPGKNPTFSYTPPTAGCYCLRMTARNTAGQTCTFSRCNIVESDTPRINATISVAEICIDGSTTLNLNNTPACGSINQTIVVWGCGTSTSVNGNPPSLTNTYSSANCAPGDYNITVIAQNSCGCFSSKTYPNMVKVVSRARADFFADTTSSLCASGLTSRFTAVQNNGNFTYTWFVNNVQRQTGPSRFFNYTFANSPTCYDVKLTVSHASGGCVDSITKTGYICAFASPNLNFTQLFTVGCVSAGGNTQQCLRGGGSPRWTVTPPTGATITGTGDNFCFNVSAIGFYTVKMVVSNGPGCTDSITRTNSFEVRAAPAPCIAISDTFSCNFPFCTNITNCNPVPGTNYSWNLGAGATPATSNLVSPPQVCYTGYGARIVALTATANGCSTTARRTVAIDTPKVSFIVQHPRGCGPLTSTLTSNTIVPVGDAITNYLWTFTTPGGPTIPAQQGPLLNTTNQTFNTPGCYGIRLEVTTEQGCTLSKQIDTLCVGVKPNCTMTVTPTVKCYDTVPVNFYFGCDTLDLIIINFGEGGTTSFPKPKKNDTIKHVYQDFGEFDVWAVIAKDSCFSDTLRSHVSIHPSRADFKDSVSCRSDSVFFINKSRQANRYHWQFSCIPDTFITKDLSALLPLCTPCMATLTVYNDSFGCSDHKTILINTACNVPPIISPGDTTICFGIRPIFTNATPRANQGLTNWYFSYTQLPVPCSGPGCYNFGGLSINPALSTGQVFPPGRHEIAMVYSANGGCIDTAYTFLNICQLDTNITPAAICLPDVASFSLGSDSLCSPVNKWKWQFTGGVPDNDTIPNPQVTYTTPGVYRVTLTASNQNGCITSLVKNISVGTAVFSNWNFDSTVCPGLGVCITNNTTSPVPMDETWLFPGGTPDSFTGHTPPCVVYNTEGDYPITYRVLAGTCDKTETRMVHIHTPVPRGTISDRFLPCPSKNKLITASSDSTLYFDANTDTVTWTFYDTIRKRVWDISYAKNAVEFFDQAGVYVATLCITTNNGCQVCVVVDTITVEGPIGFVTPNQPYVCTCKDSIDFEIRLVKTTNYVFIYGCNQGFTADSNLTPGTLQNPYIVHHRVPYCISDTCRPQLIMGDQSTCTVQMENPPVYIDSPAIVFNYTNYRVCDSGTIMFFDSTFYRFATDTSRTVSWQWDFGDSLTTADISSLQNPSYYYSQPGQYRVKLIVRSNYGCVDSVVQTIIVYPRPNAAFALSDTAICSNEQVCITDLTTAANPIVNELWSYGDGYTSPSPPPCHTYTAPYNSTYNISLVVVDSNQCVDSASTVLIMNIAPTANFTWNIVCETDSMPFHNISQAGSGALDSCLWTFWLGAPAPVADPNCNTSFLFPPGRYPVQFVVGDLNNCFDTIVDTVQIDPLTTLAINPGDTTICIGNSVNYTLQGDYSSIRWAPSIWVNDPASQSVVITPLGDVSYYVTAQSGVCPPANTSFRITVIPELPISATAVPPTIVTGLLSHLSVDSIPRNGNVVQIDSIIWSPDSTLSCNNCPDPDASPTITTTYMVTVYYSENGYTCSISDFVTVRVINSCDSGLIFVPNTFTPNGDDLNDVFMIRGMGATRINYFRIFDRWGELLFEAINGIPNETKWGWDGTDRYGKKLNGGVYVYVYELECVDREVISGKGNVTIVK